VAGDATGHYPVFLDLRGRPCVVIGGGAVAERKVKGLREAGAAVTVVSPTLGPALRALAGSGQIRHIGRAYRPGDLIGCRLAFVATDDGALNAAVAAEGRRRGVWVNAADDAARSDFILPSVLRRGALAVAVGTGGASPALARFIREELEAYFTADYADLAGIAGEVRGELRARGHAASAAAWRHALDAEVRRLIGRGRRAEAKARLSARLASP
jgi:siroheme synthase-like protein